MATLAQPLLRRLAAKGISTEYLQGFVGDLATIIGAYPQMESSQVSRRLHLLGWRGIEMDDHTIQMVIAVMEAADGIGKTCRRRDWFKHIFTSPAGTHSLHSYNRCD